MNINGGTKLEEWSADWIQYILENDLIEDMFIEFKDSLNSKDPKHNYNLGKAITSFANTFGGFFIFGIKDKSLASGWSRLSGIGDTLNFAKELTNKISSKVVPHIFFSGPRIINIEFDKKKYDVSIVKIDNSELKPHAIINDSSSLLEFWMRGSATAVPASFPYLTKMIEESSDLRNWLAALYLDTNYIDYIAEKMLISESDREKSISVYRINSLINSEQSSQVIAKIPTDIPLIHLIWKLRAQIDIANSHRDMLVQRRSLPLTNSATENKTDNDRIALCVNDIKKLNHQIRDHLTEKYAGIREWISILKL